MKKDFINICRHRRTTGGEVIDVQKWCMKELNAPFSDQERIFKNISKSFCSLNIANDGLMFLGIPPNGRAVTVALLATI